MTSLVPLEKLLTVQHPLASNIFTYSFLQNPLEYYSGSSWDSISTPETRLIADGFSGGAANYRSMIESALQKISAVVSISYSEITDPDELNDSDIRYLTSSYASEIYNGFTLPFPSYRDVWLVTNAPGFNGSSNTFTPEKVILHETLHALGIGDTWEHDYWKTEFLGIPLPYPIWTGPDDRYSVMSYLNGISGHPAENLGVYDIRALQTLYSDHINFSYNNGNNSYQFSDISPKTIWDGGGEDTIDASNQTRSTVIDLRQGALSDINSVPFQRIYNAGIAFGTVIENAIGSDQGDYIIGNVTSNELSGGDGDDVIYGDGVAFVAHKPPFSSILMPKTDSDPEQWFYSDHNGENPHNEQADTLSGGDGDDRIFGGQGYNFLHGDAGDDQLVAGGHVTSMFGGSGADTFNVGANTWIEDGETGAGDTVGYGGLRLYGGVKQWWMEGNLAYYSPFTTLMTAFPVIGAELLYTAAFFIDAATMKFARYQLGGDGTLQANLGWGQGGSMAIKDYTLDANSGVGTAGVTVFQVGSERDSSFNRAHFDQFINLALKAGFGVGQGGIDPLVLDLDGDGYNLVAEDVSSAHFEFDGDGFGEHTGWVRGTDGFLVRDANSNGLIDNVTEMFGNATTGGFAMLAGYDSNLDGVINASDTNFAALKVWQDYDQDGVTDSGELKTLTELGIVSINLSHAAPSEPTAIGGNTIANIGSFTRADSTTGGIADVALMLNETNSKWLGDNTVSTAAAALPELTGFGEVKDLRGAMTGDATLLSMVEGYAALTTTDLATLEDDAIDILFRWAGVNGVTATALGSNGFDTQKLAFLEKYSGYELMPRESGVIQLDNIDEMEALWADQLTRLTLRLAVQGPLAETFSGITYNTDRDLLVANSPSALKDMLVALLEDLPSDPTAAAAQWANWAPLLGAVAEGMVRSDANVVREDYLFAQLVAAMDGMSQPLSLTQLATALDIPNLRIGTSGAETLARGAASGTAIYYSSGGNDTLNGATGQDVYVFGDTVGHAVINDSEPKESGDRIRFATLNANQVSTARDGDDLLITVTATGETVRVTGQFAPVVPLGSDVLLSSNKGVEDIQFADGTVMEIPEIMVAVGTGTSGNDSMVGTMHSDAFLGGLGNDTLVGGDDADLYVVNAGEGDDVIREEQSTVLLRAADLLIFGDDIAPEDLVFSRAGGAGEDLVISIGTGGDSVLIQNQFGYSVLGYNSPLAPNSRIEAFAFRHYGDSWSNKDIQQKLIASATTDGADSTRGFGDDDIFDASAGNDTLIGMDGQDTYNWDAGSGNDTIDEQAAYIDIEVGLGGLSLTARADTVQFGPDIDPETLIFARPTAAPDLVITNSATGETLTVKDQFAGFQTGVLGAQWFDRMEWFAFADGTRLSWQDVEAIVTTGGSGNDHLYGELYVDTMDGKAGDDTLSGGALGDTYIFNSGYGHDTIEDGNTSFLGEGFITPDTSPDILQLGAGITPGDISFARNGSSIDLIIGGSGDRVTLSKQDELINTGILGVVSSYRVEQIKFDNGTTWDWDELNRRVIASLTTSGNDSVAGFTLEDRFLASAGNDTLAGGDSGDTYEFGLGSGHDVIRESVNNVLYGDEDVVEFAAGIAPEDVTVSRNGDHLVLTLNSNDSLTIEGEFTYSAWYTWNDVEQFKFANGTTWTKEDIQIRLLTPTSGADHIVGFDSDDTLAGAAGNDTIEGREGNDTYRFNLGDGADTIIEGWGNHNLGESDRLVFGAGILPEDIALSRDGDDLILTIAGTSDSVRIKDQFTFQAWYTSNDVDFFDFADGTTWTTADIAAILTGGTSGNDSIVGTGSSDVMNGLVGNDTLVGGDGNDIYVFNPGDGQDEIRESLSSVLLGEDDELRFGAGITLDDLGFTRSGNDLLIAFDGSTDSIKITGQFNSAAWYNWNDVERFTFADGSFITNADVQRILLTPTPGDDNFVGYISSDTLDGGTGNDTLSGGDGNDVYKFDRGYGHDEIHESAGYVLNGYDDTLLFGEGISVSDLTFARDGDDFIVTIDDTGDSIRISGQFVYSGAFTWQAVENFKFADGTVLSRDDVQAIANDQAGTSGNDSILGYAEYEDIIDGRGGNDTINGGTWDDTIIGGPGDDLLLEDGGDDVYRWNLGDGNDTIRNHGWWDGANAIEFGPGIAPGDLVFAYAGTNGTGLRVGVVGQPGSIILEEQLSGASDEGVDQLRFADGTVWSRAQYYAAAYAQFGTTGNDLLWTGNVAGTVNGGAGNDTISGRSASDTLIGGTGNDLLKGGYGDDTYVFALGDGQDIINDLNGNLAATGGDRLLFGSGIMPAGVTVVQADNGRDIIITINGTADQVTLDESIVSTMSRIDSLEFVDGTVWTWDDLLQRSNGATSGNDVLNGDGNANFLFGGGGNDTLKGNFGNDTLDGGAGNDLLQGGANDDTYLFARGGGQDIINDNLGGLNYLGNDKVELAADIAPSDVTVTEADSGNDFILAINGTTDQLTLDGAVQSANGRIEQVAFSDGTVWTHADLLARATAPTNGNDTFYGDEFANSIAGGAGNDTLKGNFGNDTLDGGAGNDLLQGGANDDTYLFARGGGQDIINDNLGGLNYLGNDKLQFAADIAPGDITVTEADNGNDFVLTINGTTDKITLDNANYSSNGRIEQVVFADGTVWTYAELLARATTPTAGNDIFYGDEFGNAISGGAGNDTISANWGNDTLSGGTGNDVLYGEGENDTYVFNIGDGQDTISEYTNSGGGTDTLQLGPGITPNDLTFLQSDNGNDITISINGTTDNIRLDNTNTGSSAYKIDQFRFDDGTVWSFSELLSHVTAGTSGNDAFWGDETANTMSGAAGNDTISGSWGNDTLSGGTGNDVLYGEGGNDTYAFNLGDGQDTISEYTSNGGGTDTLAFGANIAPGDVTVTRTDNGNDLVLWVNGTNDRITLDNTNVGTGYRIDQVTFADGTIWTHADLLARVSFASELSDSLLGTSGSDSIHGMAGGDNISGLAGADFLFGDQDNDTLAGGLGNDTLDGGAGNDSLIGDDYQATSSNLLVNGSFETAGPGATVNSWGTTVDTIPGWTKTNGSQYELHVSGHNGVAASDGGFWLETDGGWTDTNMNVSQSVTGLTSGAVYELDFDAANVMSSSTGAFEVRWNGNLIATINEQRSTMKSYRFLVTAQGGSDTVRFTGIGAADGNGASLDNVRLFATVPSTGGDDTLVGGVGNDTLNGQAGSDIYTFGLGDGQDAIVESSADSGTDSLVFGTGIAPADLSFATGPNGQDVIISIAGVSDTVTLVGAISALALEEFRFADGTTWNQATIASHIVIHTAGPDTITGTAAADVLHGGDGNDQISGVGGNDALYGDNDADTLDGGLGNDSLYGAAGNDVLKYSTGSELYDGGSGTDLLDFSSATAGVIANLGAGSNQVTGTDILQSQTTAVENLLGSGFGDSLTGDGFANAIDGGDGNDTISGTAGDDTLAGGLGSDLFLVSGTGNGIDAVDGGSGSDTIQAATVNTQIGLSSFANVEAISAGGFANVSIIGSGNADVFDFSSIALTGIASIDGAAGNDSLTGTGSADTLLGGSGNDTLIGAGGSDSLSGDANDDVLIGGVGDDLLSGGDGNDVFQVSGTGDGFDAVDGGLGTDTIQAMAANTTIGLTSLANVETISGGAFAGVSIQGSSGNDSLDFTGVTLSAITKIDGGAGADTIIGSAAADTLVGGVGNDSLNGGGGNDVFQVSGTGDGFDAIDGGSGTDTIAAQANNTTIGLSSLTGVETISGGAFTGVSIAGSANGDNLNFSAVTLSAITKVDGGSGNDTIVGSANADTIVGGAGDDNLSGSGGNDVFQVSGASDGFDAVDGGAGTDTISAMANNTAIGLSSLTGIEAISAGAFTGVTIAGSGNADTLDLSAVTLTAITKIDGGAGNDTLTGSSVADTIVGGVGDDSLAGSGGNDIFQVSGTGDGFDAVDGGAGTDTIQAQAANTAIGLRSLTGVEAITANGFTGVTIAGSGNADTLDFTSVTLTAITQVNGGIGNDTITGTGVADTLFGGNDADSLTGAAGNDTLSGDAGDDILNGGAGDDSLSGGDGNDTFKVTGTGDGFDSIDGGIGTDTISALANSTVIGLSSLTGVEAVSAGSFTGVYVSGSGNADTLNFTGATLTGINKIDGGAGNDTIAGSTGADTILGSGGDDSLNGGGGNDTLQYTGTSNGFDAVDGGSGTDTISALANSTVIGLSSLTGVEAVSAGSFTGVYVSGSANNDSLDFTSTTLTAITKIDGGAGNDTILGSAGADTILGSGGDDSLNGGGGNDTLQYTGTSNGFDAVDGGSGTDTISALANSTIIGLSSLTGVETISGGSFTGVNIAGSGNADTLNFGSTTLTAITKIDGGLGNDTITGSANADTILGSGGDDSIAAGGGNDVIQYTGTANGFDAVDGGAGTDTLSALANSSVIGLSSLTGVETISGGSFTGVYIQGSGNADTLNFSSVTLTAITRVEGGAGNDVITGNTAANTLWGGLDADTIDGGSGNDTIVGDDGDDVITGGAGNDSLNGANGTDTVDYSYATANLTVSLAVTTAQTVSTGDADTLSNFENLTGGTGADTLTGSTGNNSIKGGSGNDRMTGGAGNDSIDGGVGTTDVAVFAGLQASYTLTTVSGTTTVVDNQPSTDGNDGTDTLIATEKAEFKGGVQVSLATPIALDLDGDGVELVDKKKSKASFDWDGDGDRDKTGWVGKDDGMLVFDRNGDGSINAANELSFVDDKPGAKSDLDGLSAFDSNHDGLFSAYDDRFAQFQVWRDRNGDGKSEKKELMTLADASIASINLAGMAVNRSWGWGDNLTINTGSFTRTDGSEHAFSDIALNYSEAKGGRSRYAPAVAAASRFAEAIASFKDRGADEVTFGKHDMELTKIPVFAGEHYRNI